MNIRGVHKITDEELRVIVAKLFGWKHSGRGNWQDCHWKDKKGEWWCSCPDYPNDLNAMQKAENTLPRCKYSKYANNLGMIVDGGFIWNATARQRAEALVLTMETT